MNEREMPCQDEKWVERLRREIWSCGMVGSLCHSHGSSEYALAEVENANACYDGQCKLSR
jgi:hypothetical protein